VGLSWKSVVASLPLLTLLAGTACALPSYAADCTGCHTRTAGAFSPSTSLLEIPMGMARNLTINVTSTGGGNSGLSLIKLNAAGLGATPTASWTSHSGTPSWWSLGPFSGTGAKALNLSVPAGAVRGSYPIDVILAGGSEDWSKKTLSAFTVKVGVPGDYNDNGVVDAADYVLWRKGGPLHFEVDNPGTVNAADYTEWRVRFGKTTAGAGSGSGLETASVPEVSSVVLALLGLLAGPSLRRWRR
jgi:hypothetical protein